MSGQQTRVALVTGAARGLGLAMASGLAAAGHRVIACDVDATEPDLLVRSRDLSERGRVLEPMACDVTDSAACAALFEHIQDRFGAVEILVNNAAIGMELITPHIHANPYRFYEIDEAFWRRVLDVNVLGMFRLSRLATPAMVSAGWGRIVNITTGLGTMQKAGFAPYGPSKAAIEAATGAWAKELAGSGVTANVLIPGGPADTRMIPQEDVADRASLVRPEQMVPPLLWLASDASSTTTGRRYQARLWPTDCPPAEAERLAGANIAWA